MLSSPCSALQVCISGQYYSSESKDVAGKALMTETRSSSSHLHSSVTMSIGQSLSVARHASRLVRHVKMMPPAALGKHGRLKGQAVDVDAGDDAWMLASVERIWGRPHVVWDSVTDDHGRFGCFSGCFTSSEVETLAAAMSKNPGRIVIYESSDTTCNDKIYDQQ